MVLTAMCTVLVVLLVCLVYVYEGVYTSVCTRMRPEVGAGAFLNCFPCYCFKAGSFADLKA